MVLLVIDTQKGITDDRLYGFKELQENIRTLITASRECGVEIVYVRHDDGPGSGFSIKYTPESEHDEVGVTPKIGQLKMVA